jgi:chemotaxis response regulator CheB
MSDSTDGPSSFPIVAVGASAGGLAPTIELLHELGTEPVKVEELATALESVLVAAT